MEKDSQAYMDGIGFISSEPRNNRHLFLLSVRRMSIPLCAVLTLLPPLSKLLTPIIIYMAYLFGADIQINFFTGMLTLHQNTLSIITAIAQIVSLGLGAALLILIYKKPIKKARIFRRAHSGVNVIALPMVLALSAFGIIMGFSLKFLLSQFGIVLPYNILNAAPLSVETLISFFSYLFVGLMVEFLLHGVILTILRKFGDAFAVLTCSVLFALLPYGSSVSIVFRFVFSAVLSYFIIRSGSISTAFLCHITIVVSVFALKLLRGLFEQSLYEVTIMLVLALIFFFAGAAFVKFARSDSRAFYLAEARDKIETGIKVYYFCGGLLFLFYLFCFLSQTYTALQIIG